jgi:mannosyl-oligosaccharide alpha-1,2-mannosidase
MRGELLPLTYNTRYLDGEIQIAPTNEIIAELGSFTLEFTRLSQITGDPKWFDAAQRIMNAFESEQSKTLIPGLWPVGVNPLTLNLHTDKKFTVGAMADSVFEYLSKAHLLLSGRTPSYSTMHILMTEATKSFLTFEPLLPPSTTTQRGLSPLMLGNVAIDGKGKRILEPQGQHLVCFAGGMFALGARALSDSLPSAQYHEDMTVARRLTDGCIWSYYATNLGIGPELFYTLPCRLGRDAVTNGSEPDGTGKNGNCDWNEARWHAGLRGVPGPVKKAVNGLSDFVRDHNLEGGFTQIQDPSYGLRPEAIESVFILYRTTGDTALQDHAWNMFSAIDHYAKTSIAHAAIANVMDKPGMIMLYNEDGTEKGPAETIQHKDNMESFWTAETLKYFYLVFEDTDVVSLDGFVFNTGKLLRRWAGRGCANEIVEAHPLRWRNERGRSRGSST